MNNINIVKLYLHYYVVSFFIRVAKNDVFELKLCNFIPSVIHRDSVAVDENVIYQFWIIMLPVSLSL